MVDNDKVDVTNLNRQIIATVNTIGMSKVLAAKDRVLTINPDAEVEIFEEFFLPESRDFFDESVSYVVDSLDTVSAKIELVLRARKFGVPIISCMGTGNKLEPSGFMVDDVFNTSNCPLAKVMRKELRKRNVDRLKVVFSKEEPVCLGDMSCEGRVPGSVSFVPSCAGLVLAGEVVRDIVGVSEI